MRSRSTKSLMRGLEVDKPRRGDAEIEAERKRRKKQRKTAYSDPSVTYRSIRTGRR